MKPSRCPLCGATLDGVGLLDTCSEIHDEALGVLAGSCPHCQGRLEVKPGAGRLEVGYVVGGPGAARFDTVLVLEVGDLRVVGAGDDPASLELAAGERRWVFRAE